MKIHSVPVLGIALALFAALAIGRQTLEKIPEVDFERPTELDEDGLKQFVKYDEKCEACQGLKVDVCKRCYKREMPDCAECEGEQRSPCRVCTGTGKKLDPLIELPCPYCQGGAFYDCAQCAGPGYFYENGADGSQVEKPCGACKKVGCYPCTVCDGERRIDTVRFKKKTPAEAALKDLLKVRAELAALLEELEPFEPLERPSKTAKAMEKMVAKPGRTYPPLKDMLDLLEVVQKGLVKSGSGYKNFEERQNYQYLVFRDRTVYLLRHQLRVLDICIARAEFNEGVDRLR